MIVFIFGVGVTGRFCAQFFAGFGRGVYDGTIEKFSDTDVSLAHSVVKSMAHCEPWTDHLTPEGLKLMNKALIKNDEALVKAIIDKNSKITNAPWCIDILKTAVILACSGGPKMIKEALPATFY